MLDLRLVRRSETSRFTLTPHGRIRRFTDNVTSDADDRSLTAGVEHSFERAMLQWDAELADESTLSTELAGTGQVFADATRRTAATSAAWSFVASESRRYDASIGFRHVEYRGGYPGRLFGYRYGNASFSETLLLSPRLSFVPGVFASELDSPERHSVSRERGVSLGFTYDFSEYTSLLASIG